MSTNVKAALIVFGPILSLVVTWNYAVHKPQTNAVETFLEALKDMDAKALSEVVEPSEYPVYRSLYMKLGFNKRLLDYSDWLETDANGYFFPTWSKYSMRVKEKDIFFGIRTRKYYLSLEKKPDGWKVIQFTSPQDESDLEALKRFNPKLNAHSEQ